MGKLQFKRGAQVPAQLAAGEPFFDGEDLHIGKLGGAGGNKKIGNETGASIKTKLEALTGNARLDAAAIKNLPEGGGGGGIATLVEWSVGDDKPTVDADRQVGEFFEGKMHVVTTHTVGEETVAVVQVENWVEGFNPSVFDSTLDCIFYDLDEINGTPHIFVGGSFTGHLMRLNPTTGYENLIFDMSAPAKVTSIVEHIDGHVIVAGGVAGVSGFIRLYDRNRQYNTVLFTEPTLNGIVNDCIQDQYAKFVAVGEFTGGIMQFYGDGTPVVTFQMQAPSAGILCVMDYGDGYYIGGNLGLNKNLQKIDYDGNIVQESFEPPTITSPVSVLSMDNDGNVYVGTINGQLLKFDSYGVLDVAFVSNINQDAASYVGAGIKSMLNGDGHILVNGVEPDSGVGNIVRISYDGLLDNSFSTIGYNAINSMSLDPNGYLFAGITDDEGNHKLIRLDADGDEINDVAEFSFIGEIIAKQKAVVVPFSEFIEDTDTGNLVYTIKKAGEYVFVAVYEENSQAVSIDTTDMLPGEKIKIFFSPESYGVGADVLSLIVEPDNYIIGNPLQRYGYAEFLVIGTIGDTSLHYIYSSNYIGQAT